MSGNDVSRASANIVKVPGNFAPNFLGSTSSPLCVRRLAPRAREFSAKPSLSLPSRFGRGRPGRLGTGNIGFAANTTRNKRRQHPGHARPSSGPNPDRHAFPIAGRLCTTPSSAARSRPSKCTQNSPSKSAQLQAAPVVYRWIVDRIQPKLGRKRIKLAEAPVPDVAVLGTPSGTNRRPALRIMTPEQN